MRNKERKKATSLCFGSVILGITVTICAIIIIRSVLQIEFAKEHVSFFREILYWVFEWVIIIINVVIPWFVWKKLVKPYLKD